MHETIHEMKIELFLFTIIILTSCKNKSVENDNFTKTETKKEIAISQKETLKIPIKILTSNDTLKLVDNIKKVIELEQNTEYSKFEKILRLQHLMLNGKSDNIIFIEFEYGYTSGASWPGKCQLFFTENGKLIGRVDAEKYKFLRINKTELPYFYTLETTQHGNGGHNLYRISNDTLENTLDGFSVYFLRTYDSDETTSINEPFELKMKISDFNNDKLNDISFSGKIIKYAKKYPVDFQFLYNKKTGHFSEKEDYCKKYNFIGHD